MLSKEEHNERLKLYKQGLSDAKIAQVLFLSTSAIFHWRRKANLPVNLSPKNYAKIDSKENMKRYRLYCNGLKDREIAEICNVSPHAINSWRYHRGLQSNHKLKKERKEENTMFVKAYPKEMKEKFFELYEKGLTYGQIAKELGVSRSTTRRWGNEIYGLEPNYSPDMAGHRYVVKYVDRDVKKAVRMMGFAKNKEAAKKTVLEQLMKSRNKAADNFVFVSCERRDRGDIKRNDAGKVYRNTV